MTLVHFGSWGNDPGRPLEEMIGPLPVRDVAWYGKGSIARILEIERPDAVLMFSTRHMVQRAFLRYCRQRGIPTVHAYHGLVRVQAVDHGGRAYKLHWFAFLRFAAGRAGKSLFRTFPTYARALRETSGTSVEWRRFLLDIWDLALGRVDKEKAPDARTSKCCVYTEADVPHAVSHYGFAPEDVIPVGNPDLLAFGLTGADMGAAIERPGASSRDVVYIDTALLATGLLFRSDADFIAHMLRLRDALQGQGRRLLFKPHPDMRLRGIDRALAAQGIETVSNEEFVAVLRRCCAAVVETTTAALVPALMGMPLFLARFGRLEDLQFGEVLRSYPRALELGDPLDFDRLLTAEAETCDPDRVVGWIRTNAGPLPASDMPRRLAEVILDLVQRPADASRPARQPSADTTQDTAW